MQGVHGYLVDLNKHRLRCEKHVERVPRTSSEDLSRPERTNRKAD